MSVCSRCGKCHSYCPAYKVWLDERFSPRGKYLLLEKAGPQSVEDTFLNDLAWSCLQCGACEALCPSSANVAQSIRTFRETQEPPIYMKDFEKILSAVGRGSKLAKILNGLPFGAGLISRIVKITPWGMPRVPRESFFEALGTKREALRGDIALFVGCIQNFIYPEIPLKAITLGTTELFCPGNQTCCGLPAWSSGMKETAKALAAKNLFGLVTSGTRHILTLCSSCEFTIREVWPRLFEPGTEEWNLAQRASSMLLGMSEFLVAHAKNGYERVILHTPCHVRHGGTVAIEGYEALAQKAGWKVVWRINECCGMGGTFSYTYPEMSKKIFESACQGLFHDKEGGGLSGLLLTQCSGCLLQWRMGLKGHVKDSTKSVLHPIELL